MIRFRHLPLMHGYRAYYGAIVLTLIDGASATAAKLRWTAKR